MRSTYPAKSGRLDDLLGEVVRFFETKSFLVSAERNDSQIVVSVRTSESSRNKIVDVRLAGDGKGSLAVSFESVEGSPLVRNSVFLSLLGAGILTLKRQKMSETMERLEKDFWKMVDEFMVSS